LDERTSTTDDVAGCAHTRSPSTASASAATELAQIAARAEADGDDDMPNIKVFSGESRGV
jgi:hypothetical protein